MFGFRSDEFLRVVDRRYELEKFVRGQSERVEALMDDGSCSLFNVPLKTPRNRAQLIVRAA